MKEAQTSTFGNIIKKARLAAGLSMGEAAADADISKSLLRFWELDQVETPDLSKVLRLASTLGLDPLALCEAAGYDLTATLPTMKPYLRSKYPELPDSALREIASITQKYGIGPAGTGPRPGEDER